MYDIINFLYFMIFNETNEISFIGFNHQEKCSAWVDKFFMYYVIQYSESGELDLFTDDRPARRLCGPVVWLTFPGPYFKFGRRDGGCWNHRFVSFKGPLAERYEQSGLFPSAREVIPITEPEKFSTAFDRLLQRLAAGGDVDFRTVHMLEELLLQLSEQPVGKYELPPSVTAVNRIIAEVERNPLLEWNWKEVARMEGISYPHFRKLFHDAVKMPPAHFLLLKRLGQSASLLRSSGMKLGEVAVRCGFYDEFHYSKLFKKYCNMSPGQYRKNHTLK